ncbi:MAG TPA: ABC transporter permease [Gammaproteobacteria bacterium]|jgi:ABC-2 type transport system permease protein|nr:ABC transporter permease [Gammaproteobacteria bacterium]|tara:strand:+ start:3368 stop:4468 length:1101 start_codon:yes stop_codon:yes gene_type:complete
MKSLTRIFSIMRKEFLQLGRDRLTFGMIIGIPLIQLLMFGYAINTDVRNLSAAYADEADSHLSRRLVSDLRATQVINIQQRVSSVQELNRLMDAGLISIGIYIPDDFDRRVLQRDRPALQLLVDGTDPILLGVAQQLTAMPVRFDSQPAIPGADVLMEVRNFYNPERRSAVNIVPGLLGVILTMTMVMFTAVAIVREKERGNMELLINTPIRTPELMLGKIFPYIFIGLIQLVIILALGRYLFQVPIRGSELHILLASLLFIATNLSLGLLVSTMATTQFQAMQMTFFVLLPSILLSGFMFPFDGMPILAQRIAEVLPLTHFNRLIRGIMLRGVDIMSMWDEAAALGTFMLVALTLAIARFRKRLD